MVDILDVLIERGSNNLGQMAIEVIDADGDTAIVGELGTGARTVPFIVDLAIILAVSRRGHVVFG